MFVRLLLGVAAAGLIAVVAGAQTAEPEGQWFSRSFHTGEGRPRMPVPVTVTFANGRVSGRSPCNTYFGPYAVRGGAISVGPLSTTRMLCAPERMQEQRRFLRLLGSARTWRLQNEQLTLRGADGELVLNRTLRPPGVVG